MSKQFGEQLVVEGLNWFNIEIKICKNIFNSSGHLDLRGRLVANREWKFLRKFIFVEDDITILPSSVVYLSEKASTSTESRHNPSEIVFTKEFFFEEMAFPNIIMSLKVTSTTSPSGDT